jgi:hypothetical protein
MFKAVLQIRIIFPSHRLMRHSARIQRLIPVTITGGGGGGALWSSCISHIFTMSHWSSGLTICFPPQGAAFRTLGVQPTLWNWDLATNSIFPIIYIPHNFSQYMSKKLDCFNGLQLAGTALKIWLSNRTGYGSGYSSGTS